VRQDGKNFRFGTGGIGRRVLVQEFVTDLRTIGTSTTGEMEAASVGMFKLPATRDELTELVEVARRLGFVEPRERRSRTEVEWVLSKQGRKLPAPRSLDVPQVVLSVARLADPVRKQAVDWLPTIALLLGVGAVTTEAGNDEATANVAAAVSIALLAVVVAVHARGELGLRSAARSWERLKTCRPATYRFHTGSRIPVVFAFVTCFVTAYGLALFGLHKWAALVGAVGVVLAIGQWWVWHFPAICEYHGPYSRVRRRSTRVLLAGLLTVVALASVAGTVVAFVS
jgi:hypothetical protein